VFNNSTDLVRGTDFSNIENTKKYSVEELAEYLSIAEEFKNMYADNQVPASREQYAV
jgi:hypothetical protein